MNGINIPKNVSDDLQYTIINANTSQEFEDRIKGAIEQASNNNCKILTKTSHKSPTS